MACAVVEGCLGWWVVVSSGEELCRHLLETWRDNWFWNYHWNWNWLPHWHAEKLSSRRQRVVSLGRAVVDGNANGKKHCYYSLLLFHDSCWELQDDQSCPAEVHWRKSQDSSSVGRCLPPDRPPHTSLATCGVRFHGGYDPVVFVVYCLNRSVIADVPVVLVRLVPTTTMPEAVLAKRVAGFCGTVFDR